mmetsp:Transcript_40177/g.110643  ORF Transcript_40177/g.110643 Transcript_40177/m.110643 type:complete len:200 (-) Transcript_40177:189-788(-)
MAWRRSNFPGTISLRTTRRITPRMRSVASTSGTTTTMASMAATQASPSTRRPSTSVNGRITRRGAAAKALRTCTWSTRRGTQSNSTRAGTVMHRPGSRVTRWGPCAPKATARPGSAPHPSRAAQRSLSSVPASRTRTRSARIAFTTRGIGHRSRRQAASTPTLSPTASAPETLAIPFDTLGLLTVCIASKFRNHPMCAR